MHAGKLGLYIFVLLHGVIQDFQLFSCGFGGKEGGRAECLSLLGVILVG